MHLLVSPIGQVAAVREAVPDYRVVVAESVEEAQAWQDALYEDSPPEVGRAGYAISPAGMSAIMDEIEADRLEDAADPVPEGLADWERELAEGWARETAPLVYRLGPLGTRFVRCATDFREFLNVWRFRDQDTGVERTLGEVLWPGQETFVREAVRDLWVYFLKNRQIGYTTTAIAYDAWVMRFRSPNARVHLVSRTETVAKDTLLVPLKFGLQRLPDEMQLPVSRDTTTIYELESGEGATLIAQAFAAKEPGRAYTCSHLHLDEWAAMAETKPELPKDVWAAAEPTISKHGGSCHILCTGVGPVGYYADVWKTCVAGEGQLTACFIPATGARPEYTPAFLADKKHRMADDVKFAHEYPERWEDALSGGGGLRFRTRDVDAVREMAMGVGLPGRVPHPLARRRRRYVKAWDIAGPGERSDAVVGVVLDVTDVVWHVVALVYNRGEDYPVTAQRIERVHQLFPGDTVIEDNEAGQAVRSFLNIPSDQVHGFRTTRQSKPVIIEELALALSYQTIKWVPEECPKLDVEVRGYQLPDDTIEQDCVMALAIGIHHAATAPRKDGTVFKTFNV